MSNEPTQLRGPAIRALARDMLDADATSIIRIVATVDAMAQRGQADLLIEPLRQRLATIQPPRPLRFGRLVFYPLDRLIVPASRWRPGQHALPRTALTPMADQISMGLGTEAAAIKAEIHGRTTADADLISRLGRSLWPAAAAILANTAIPQSWDSTGLGDPNYRPLARAAAALLAEAAALDALHAEAITGLLPAGLDLIQAMLRRVAKADPSALPMMIAMLLDRVPAAAEMLAAASRGPEAPATTAAMDEAVDLLLRQLDQQDGIETRIAAGSLVEAGVAVNRIAVLLKHLDRAGASPQRREQVRIVRQRLETDCRARFESGLQDELLVPLRNGEISSSASDVAALEAAARGLRVLETEARVAGGGPSYDRLLSHAAETIKTGTTLPRTDQIRLVEILRGPDAALAMLNAIPP